ncbi:MAG: STAS/SEC14 domain-containing protein [Bacteroidetes bacterium]|nr:STAS/SEC14 domain-containing protein [Bacteroidota bacterium]
MPRVLESIKKIDTHTIEIRYKEKVNVTVSDMREILDTVYEFTENKPVKRLVVITDGSSLELKARLLLQEENKIRKDYILAEAVLVNSLAQKMLTNFYLKFIKDSFPSKFFTDYDKALEWIKEQPVPKY